MIWNITRKFSDIERIFPACKKKLWMKNHGLAVFLFFIHTFKTVPKNHIENDSYFYSNLLKISYPYDLPALLTRIWIFGQVASKYFDVSRMDLNELKSKCLFEILPKLLSFSVVFLIELIASSARFASLHRIITSAPVRKAKHNKD